MSSIARAVARTAGLVLVAALAACGGGGTASAPPTLELLAGTADPGGSGFVDGRGDAARFFRPSAIAIDGEGRLVVADAQNNAVRRVDSDGKVTTLVYDTLAGDAGERLDAPLAVAVAPGGEVYFVTRHAVAATTGLPNWMVRAVSSDGRVRTVVDASKLGSGAQPSWRNAHGMAVAADGRIFIADGLGCAIRIFEPGRGLRTFAEANERPDGRPCESIETLRYGPGPIALDAAGNLYYSINESIVRIAADGSRTRRPAPVLYTFSGLVIAGDGTAYATNSARILRIAQDGTVSVVAGAAAEGSTDGVGADARFSSAYGLARDAQGNLFVADTYNHTIRRIDPDGRVSTFAGRPEQSFWRDGPGPEARFGAHGALVATPDGNLYLGDASNYVVRGVDAGGSVRTVAGQPSRHGSQDGPGGVARLGFVQGLLVESSGELLVAEPLALRRVKRDGSIETLPTRPPELLGVMAALPDGGQLLTTYNGSIGFDGSSEGWCSLFLRRPGSEDRKLLSSRAAGMSTLFFNGIRGLAVAADGRIFFTHGHAVYEWTGTDQVKVVAGLRDTSGSADGPGAAARFNSPYGLAIDREGRMYVADSGNHVVRRIARDGSVSTFVGRSGVAGIAPGPLPAGLHTPTDLAITPQGLVIRSQLALLRVALD